MTEPEAPIHIRKIDFSEFHPLDHSLLRCQDYPGGRRRHWEYQWDFKTRPALTGFFGRPLCWVGRHALRTWSRTVGPNHTGPVDSFRVCDRCGWRPTPSTSASQP